MALQLAPVKNHPASTNNLTTRHSTLTPSGAPSAPGLHDTLRHNLAAPQTLSTHPLEARLASWRCTQQSLKMTGLRRTFGIAEPVRRGMELAIVRGGEWRSAALGGSDAVSGDVLEGRDWAIEWEDVFIGDQTKEALDFHSEMEARLKMSW